MSTEPTPAGKPDNAGKAATPPTAPAANEGEAVASQFLASELEKARKSLRRTRLAGLIVAAVVFGYMSFVSSTIVNFLEPKSAASLANGFISEHVSEKATELSSELKTRIPELIADLPNFVIKQVPEYREALEHHLESDFSEYSHATARQMGKHLDDYLDSHIVQIRTLLTTTQDRHAIKQLGPDLEQTIMEYLSDKPDDGESIKDKISKTLEALKHIEAQVDRIANGKDLTPQEKKTRKIIAVISRTLDDTTK